MNNTINIEELREILFAAAYQMLGETADAEDIVQELLMDCSEKLADGRLREVANIRGYYVRAAVNRSINRLKVKKREEYPGIWLPEPLINIEKRMDAQVDISYGFVHLLSKLNPKERGVFILRESFDMNFKEISEDLDLGYDHCRKLHQRGKKKMKGEKLAEMVDEEKKEALLTRFIGAIQEGRVEDLIAYLREDIVIYSDGGGKVAAARNPLFGPEVCAKFLVGIQKLSPEGIRVDMRHTETGTYMLLFEEGKSIPRSVVFYEIWEEKIGRIFIQRNPEKLGGE